MLRWETNSGVPFQVADITARDALNAYEGMTVRVLDASADASVGSGWATYIYSNGAFVKTNESEAIDAFNFNVGIHVFALTAPEAAAADNILDGVTLSTTEVTEVTEFDAQPDFPRCVQIVSSRNSETAAASATATTELTGDNNDLVFTAPAGAAGNGTTVEYVDPGDALEAADLTTALAGDNNDLTYTAVTKGVGGNSITVAYTNPGAGTTAASYTTEFGANNDLVFTAKKAGSGGDDITIEYVAAAEGPVSLSVDVDGKAITVNLDIDESDNIITTAGAIITAIEASPAATALVAVANAGEDTGAGVVAALPPTNLSGGVDSDEVVTVTESAISVALAHDGDGCISTAADVIAAVEASSPASALVTVVNAADNDGTGLVIAMNATNLSGGVDTPLSVAVDGTAITVTLKHNGTAIVSTAAEVDAAIDASPEAAALVTPSNADGNSGEGVVTEMATITLTGGHDLLPTTGNVVVTGTDYADAVLTETLALNGTTSVVGTKAFKTITSIELPMGEETEGVDVGTTDKFGLNRIVTYGKPIYADVDGTKETTDPVITTDATLPKNVILFNTATNGTRDFNCFYIDVR